MSSPVCEAAGAYLLAETGEYNNRCVVMSYFVLSRDYPLWKRIIRISKLYFCDMQTTTSAIWPRTTLMSTGIIRLTAQLRTEILHSYSQRIKTPPVIRRLTRAPTGPTPNSTAFQVSVRRSVPNKWQYYNTKQNSITECPNDLESTYADEEIDNVYWRYIDAGPDDVFTPEVII